MLNIFIVYLLYFVKEGRLQSCEAENQYSWSYHGPDNGPSHWGDFYPDCNEKLQSPIEILEEKVIDGFPELEFSGYDKPITKAKVQNFGWTVMIIPEDDVQRYIKWGDAVYNLKNIHFHFGSESDPGAENIINGVTYPMEIQYYNDLEDFNVTGILSSLIDVNDEDNSAFGPITDVLSKVKYRDDAAELESDLDLSQLLPEKSREYYYYYSYFGSNSIPPCNPAYVWWILKDIGKIGHDQLHTFMTLYSVEEDDASDECLMGPNSRPVQDLDDRGTFSGPWFYTSGED